MRVPLDSFELRLFLFLPLYTQPRRRGILRSPLAGSCIDPDLYELQTAGRVDPKRSTQHYNSWWWIKIRYDELFLCRELRLKAP